MGAGPGSGEPVPVRTLEVAARGWDHDCWAGIYYPDDLPVDWRLTYYANEFRAVTVPAPSWLEAGPAGCGEWAGEVSEGFRFYLELPDLSDRAAFGLLEPCCRGLGINLGGVIGWVEPPVGLLQLPADIPLLGPIGEPIEGCRVVGDRGRIAVLLESDAGSDLRRLRRLMEGLAAWDPAVRHILMVFPGFPSGIGQLQQGKILADMLGLS